VKTPSKFPDVSLQTPLASGVALASTSAPDMLLLLQQQAALLANQQQEIQRLQAENKHIQSLEEENKRLKLALAHHARMRFGAKSEVFNEQQRDLFAEDWQVDDTDLQQHLEQLSSTSKVPRVRAGRQALAMHLPRIEVRHEPASCTCASHRQQPPSQLITHRRKRTPMLHNRPMFF
jgi:transposase